MKSVIVNGTAVKSAVPGNNGGARATAEPATPAMGKSVAGTLPADSITLTHMRRMAPQAALQEEITPPAALMCHIMLLNSVLERRANRFAEAHGLTFPQWMALGCIGHCGDKGIRHAELGNHLMLSKAPVTGVVDRLERSGYVRRVADTSDRRVSRIVITPPGEDAWRQVRQTLRERSEELCACLSTHEQSLLLSLLARLLEDASRADPILTLPLAHGRDECAESANRPETENRRAQTAS